MLKGRGRTWTNAKATRKRANRRLLHRSFCENSPMGAACCVPESCLLARKKACLYYTYYRRLPHWLRRMTNAFNWFSRKRILRRRPETTGRRGAGDRCHCNMKLNWNLIMPLKVETQLINFKFGKISILILRSLTISHYSKSFLSNLRMFQLFYTVFTIFTCL